MKNKKKPTMVKDKDLNKIVKLLLLDCTKV